MKIDIRCTGTENISLDAFTELQGNLKELSNENYEKLKASLIKYGFCFPVFCWKDGKTFFILDAHQRCKTLKQLRTEGYTIPDLPTVYIEAKDKIEAKELLFQLNSNYGKMTQDGVYEFLNEPGFELLPEILNEVDLPEFDLDKFNAEFYEEESDGSEDEVPDVPENPVSILGDLWLLGEHRLLCGDSTKKEDVERLMDGEKADMVFTDPPYGDNHAGSNMVPVIDRRKGKSIVGSVNKIKNDSDIEFLGDVFLHTKNISEDGCPKFVFFKWNKWEKIKNLSVGFGEPKAVCVWDRDSQGASTFRINPVHEFCFYWGTLGDKKETGNLRNVWRCRKDGDRDLHPTVKPVEIIEPCIRMCAEKDVIIYDPFLGSGSTLIACEKTNRKCYGMEIDPHYCDVIIKRWEEYSGKIAKHESGKTFVEIEKERATS